MELFKLLGTIAVENSDANKAIDDTTGKAQDSESKIGKFFGGLGKGAAVAGKAIAKGLAVGSAVMTGITTKALSMSGDLEQNLGGSEAVFKNFAGKMQDIGKTAFKDMGLSSSDFLATANKMGALFQGSGFGIKESADLSSKAMQRAADVASVMGISTGDAMEAISGAAKGNFEMMDNLGVSMNDTSIAAYAASKGINKSTAEMTQQEKVGLAMQMFLDKTSYAAGNYAKENDTLAGSLGTAKAALSNFLSGSGNVDDVVSSFSNAAMVIVKNLNTIVPKLVTGITDLVKQLVPLIPPLLQSLLPGIIEGAVQLINGLVSALPMVINALMGALPALISGIEQIFNSLVAALPQIIQVLADALPTIIPQLVNALISMVLTLMKYLPQIIQPIIDNLPEIITTLIDAQMKNLPALINGLIQLVIGIVKALPQIILALIEALPTVISSIVNGLFQSLPVLIQGIIQILGEVGKAIWDTLSGIFTMIWDVIKSIFAPVGDFFKNIWDGIKNIFSVVADFFKGIFEKASKVIHTVIDPWIEIFSRIWGKIKEAFAPVVQFFGDIFSKAWNGIKAIFAPVGDFFKGIWNGIKSAFGAVTDWFKNIFSNAWNAVKNVFSAGGKIFDGIKNGIANVFKTVVNGIIKGINKVISIPFNAINAMLSKIKDISILGVSPFSWISTFKVPQIPTLVTGGVLKKGQTGYLEGDGDEAVVPLERNTGWIRTVAEKIHAFTLETKITAQNVSSENGMEKLIQSNVFQENGIVYLNDKLDKIINVLKEFFPTFAEGMEKNLVLDTGVLVGALAPGMDRQLGTIYKRRMRGN